MKTIFRLFLTAFCMLVVGTPASADSVKPFLVKYSNIPKLTEKDIPLLAGYELIIIDRFRFNQINKNTWKAIKAASPDTKIYLYQAGPVVSNKHDSHSIYYLNNLGRYDVSRNSPRGSLNKDHPDWFLKNIFGKRVNMKGWPYLYYLDFGNSEFIDYWIEHTLEDISFQEWRADGVFMDNAIACRFGDRLTSNSGDTPGEAPEKYLSCDSWDKNMNKFVAKASSTLHKQNQLLATNRGHSRSAAGTAAWIALDKAESTPDFLLEEGAFAMNWGGGDAQFLPVEEWRRQIDLPASIKHSAIGMLSHTDLARNEKGFSMRGEPVTYDQILRFSVGSYLLARNHTSPTTYFKFVANIDEVTYTKLVPTDFYSPFEIGAPVKNYEAVPKKEIYFRKYSDGYVYVNPTDKKITNIKLAPGFQPRDSSENLTKVDAAWYLDLQPHDAAILKSRGKIELPSAPNFLLQ